MKLKPKYKRTVLFQNNDVEVILIDWDTESETPIHDHGKSRGLIKVLKGSLREEVFLLHKKFPMEKAYSRFYRSGSVVLEFPNFIHCMKNAGKTRARSLHIYTPPLRMREYKKLDKKI